MGQPAVWVFDRFEDAQRAYDELRAQGFSPDELQWQASDDEAGPVKGNFWVGNADPELADGKSGTDSRGEEKDTYDRDFANPSQVGGNILLVSAQADQGRAGAIASRLGGTQRL